jgi:putative nucleotidyltransferase with HDIG domain
MLPKFPAPKGGVPSIDQLLAGAVESANPGDELGKRVIERFQSSAYQPPLLADVAARLVELSRRPFKPTEAHQLLERDPFFAGRVLQVAQSPVHNGGAPVTSLAEAVTRLGHTTLGPMFMLASTKMRVFRTRAYLRTMEQVQAHSLAVAHLAKLASRHAPSVDPQVAFTAGLLHDVGIMAALMIHGDPEGAAIVQGTAAAAASAQQQPVDVKDLWPAVRAMHARTTQWLCSRWKLPAVLANAVANHHDIRPANHPDPLAALVALADGLATDIGFPALDEVDPGQVPAALASLGLGPAQRESLLADATSIQAQVICR